MRCPGTPPPTPLGGVEFVGPSSYLATCKGLVGQYVDKPETIEAVCSALKGAYAYRTGDHTFAVVLDLVTASARYRASWEKCPQ